MIKSELRSIYREKRKAISTTDKEKWDDLLLIQFQQFDFSFFYIYITDVFLISSILLVRLM